MCIIMSARMYIRIEMSTGRGSHSSSASLAREHANKLIDRRAALGRGCLVISGEIVSVRSTPIICSHYALLLLRSAAFLRRHCVCFRTCSKPPWILVRTRKYIHTCCTECMPLTRRIYTRERVMRWCVGGAIYRISCIFPCESIE